MRLAADDSVRIVLDVRQVVRDLQGAVIARAVVQQVDLVEDGLIRRMGVRRTAGSGSSP